MKKIVVLLLCLTSSLAAYAQEARSPQELAAQLQSLIETKNSNGAIKLIHSGADPASVERLKLTLAAYVGTANLKIYPVPKDDKEAVRAYMALFPDFFAKKTLPERVKKLADSGWFFETEPLGDIVLIGRPPGEPSSGGITSMVYGKLDGRYLIIFAKQK